MVCLLLFPSSQIQSSSLDHGEELEGWSRHSELRWNSEETTLQYIEIHRAHCKYICKGAGWGRSKKMGRLRVHSFGASAFHAHHAWLIFSASEAPAWFKRLLQMSGTSRNYTTSLKSGTCWSNVETSCWWSTSSVLRSLHNIFEDVETLGGSHCVQWIHLREHVVGDAW